MPEDPEAESKLHKAELDYHHSKLPQDAGPFKQVGGNLKYGTFVKPLLMYGGPSMALTKPTQGEAKYHSQKILNMHEGAQFKPAGPGKKNKTLSRFPSFMPDPPREKVRVKKDENAEYVPPFKPSTRQFTRPTPSIVTNFRNMRSTAMTHL